MKYIQTYEQSKEYYMGDTKYIITTIDEKYVYFKYSGVFQVFLPIEALENNFHRPGVTGLGRHDDFLYDRQDSANSSIKRLMGYYYMYFLPDDSILHVTSFVSSGKVFKPEYEVKTKEPEDKLKLKVIEYKIGAYRTDVENNF